MQNKPTTFFTQASTFSGPTGRMAFLRRLIGRYPYLGAFLLLVYWLVLLVVLGRLLSLVLSVAHAHVSLLLANLLGELLMVLVVALALSLLGWWSEVGFTRGITGGGIVVCLVPVLLIAGPALLGSLGIVGTVPLSLLLEAVLLSLLVGFAEEGMFRGLILRSLLPKGIWPAVLLSALCFACVHLTNVFHSASWSYVAEQMILAFGAGVLFAAIRLRTGSIWPVLLLHAIRDVAGLILLGVNPSIINTPLSSTGLIVNVLFCLFFLLNALILLRASQVRKLRMIYHLVPVPAAMPSGTLSQTYMGAASYPNYTSPEAYGEPPSLERLPYTPFEDRERQ